MIAAAPSATPSLDINVFRRLKPLPTHLRFLQSNAKFKDYQSPFGSGKTEVLSRWTVYRKGGSPRTSSAAFAQ